jgi:hypothetical protein
LARALILKTLRSTPCTDCGERDLRVLEFDHLDDKVASVAALLAAKGRLARLEAEIRKCEVVCVNCHRRRTASRARWRRAQPDWRQALDGLTPPVRRNLTFIYSTLEESGCVECREGDIVLLDFDHVGVKSGAVTALARSGVSLGRVIAEVAQCQVRCANCHRRRTLAASGSYRLDAAA